MTNTHKLIKYAFIFSTVLLNQLHAQEVLTDDGSIWKYLDDGSDQGTAWKEIGFDDSSWDSGPAVLGFNNSNIDTSINNHQNPVKTGAATWYFRKTFDFQSPDDFSLIKFEIMRDDGAVVYLNGTEIGRSNMPDDDIFFDTLADSSVGGINEKYFFSSSYAANNLVQGENVLAVEIHQRSLDSSDLVFDMRLIGADTNLVRGPYIQNQTPNALTIRWRSFEPVNSQVNWGTAVGKLKNFIGNSRLKTEHEIQITGLSPGQKYYYSVGTSTEVYTDKTEQYHFIMPPVLGSKQPFRMWVLGDSGTANANASAVKNSYLQFNQNNDTHLWLMLGDNAYNRGTDSEYQAAVFDMYPELLKNSALWSTIGNHDRGNANSIMQTGVYYDIFTFPKFAYANGLSTGVDSATEAYYSFDYGNVHFVVLESHETNSTFRAGMVDWLNSDLMMTNADWVIALWHHPPYTKGSHDSDKETQPTYMRENILSILEDKGVDLVLTGHSHSYERSWLIDGHYGHSDTFDANYHVIDGSDGTPQISPYTKDVLGLTPNDGTVYVVAGSSGKISGNQGEAHEAMRNLMAVSELGSLVIDVNHRVMDVKFLNDKGQVSDEFQIIKGDLVFMDAFETD